MLVFSELESSRTHFCFGVEGDSNCLWHVNDRYIGYLIMKELIGRKLNILPAVTADI